MKKSKRTYLLAVVLLLLAVVSCYSMTGTYAKYASEFTGNGDASAAKWAWTVNTVEMNKDTKDFTLDLFKDSKLYEADCTTEEQDTDVNGNLLAPGTCGAVTINITNASDVKARYGYSLALANADNIPLVWSTDKSAWGDLASVEKAMDDANVLARNMTTGTDVATLYWKWAFEGDDTTIGWKAATEEGSKVTLTATLNVEQMD